MATEAQIAANAANAQLSTGPSTEEGKARSARNAVKHGLTSKDLVVSDQEIDELQQLVNDLKAELKPEGATESLIFQEIIHASWNLRRVRRLEASYAFHGEDPLRSIGLGPFLDRLARYRTGFERAFYRALKELRATQTNRMLREQILNQNEAEAIPALASVEALQKQRRAKRTQSKRESETLADHLVAGLETQTAALLSRLPTGTVPSVPEQSGVDGGGLSTSLQ
jgi:hypothetical protein